MNPSSQGGTIDLSNSDELSVSRRDLMVVVSSRLLVGRLAMPLAQNAREEIRKMVVAQVDGLYDGGCSVRGSVGCWLGVEWSAKAKTTTSKTTMTMITPIGILQAASLTGWFTP